MFRQWMITNPRGCSRSSHCARLKNRPNARGSLPGGAGQRDSRWPILEWARTSVGRSTNSGPGLRIATTFGAMRPFPPHSMESTVPAARSAARWGRRSRNRSATMSAMASTSASNAIAVAGLPYFARARPMPGNGTYWLFRPDAGGRFSDANAGPRRYRSDPSTVRAGRAPCSSRHPRFGRCISCVRRGSTIACDP